MRVRQVFATALAASSLLTACASTPSSVGADAGNDGSAAVDGGCTEPTAGATCMAAQTPCQPADPCCAGFEWFCNANTHVWQKLRRGCPPPPNCTDAGIESGAD
jgi:hypothetical protein